MSCNIFNNGFKYPRNIPKGCDLNSLEKINIWLRQKINTLAIGQPIRVGKISRASRDVAYIKPHRNIDGVKYLLGKLYHQGYIEFTDDNIHFVVLKRTSYRVTKDYEHKRKYKKITKKSKKSKTREGFWWNLYDFWRGLRGG